MRAKCSNSGDLMTIGLQTVVCPFVTLSYHLRLSVDPKESLQPGLKLNTGFLEADKSTEAHCNSQIR